MKTQEWISKNKWFILLGLIVFILLIKLNIIPSTFTTQTFSILGGATVTLTIGAIMTIVGLIILITVPGIGLILGPLIMLGACRKCIL